MKLTTTQVMDKIVSVDLTQMVVPGKNKGERGQSLELLLGIPNSSALTDLEDGELKTFTLGESIAVTQLGHCLDEVINGHISFEKSKLGQKLRQTIYVVFAKTGQYKGSRLLTQDTDGLHYQHLEEDFYSISEAIRTAFEKKRKIGTTNGPNNLLQIRTKASKNSKGGYTPLMFNGVELKDKGMAFYLKGEFGKKILHK
jgi:DNA mismatch repair protein MutH|tara:strand:- start:56 stop:652 length:597 start_codon:yes stop_codon:yes gene_type:complete